MTHQSNRWVRENGQAEMRDIVRTAIKESDLSQREVAEQAGIKRNHLVGFLGDNNWLRRDALEAIAHVLRLPAEDLIGNSIFAEERDRYSEFDHMPPRVVASQERREAAKRENSAETTAQAEAGRTRALCCECGTLRTCTTQHIDWEPDLSHGYDNRGRRVTRQLKCAYCDQKQMHAVLVWTEDRDLAEQRDHAPTAHTLALMERDNLVTRLRGFNVDLVFRPSLKHERDDEPCPLNYSFDSGAGRWCIEIDDLLPPRAQVRLINRAWKRIAADDFADLAWDPREDGTMSRASDDDWDAATDDLITDLRRFLAVERRRFVTELRDEAMTRGESATAPGNEVDA